MAAGLLTTLDFAAAIKEIGAQRAHAAAPAPAPSGLGRDFDLLLLPGIAFDSRGRDLLGRPWTALRPLTRALIRTV